MGVVSWLGVRVGRESKAYLAGEGDKVVLAEGEDLNVLDDDELVVVLVENSAINDVPQVLLVAFGEEQHGLCVALRRVEQALAVGILAQTLQHSPHRARQLLQVLRLLLLGSLDPVFGARAGPAQPVQVDRGDPCVGAVGAAGSQRGRRLRVVFVAHFAVLDKVFVVHTAAVGIGGGAFDVLGEVAVRSVEVDYLPAAFGDLDGVVEAFTLFLVARLGGVGRLLQRRADVRLRAAVDVRGNGIRLCWLVHFKDWVGYSKLIWRMFMFVEVCGCGAGRSRRM